MNLILAIPLEVRLIGLFAIGSLVGRFANLATYGLACGFRAIEPYSKHNAANPTRRWFDRLPIIGWFIMRRETPQHRTGFWVRPMLVELLTGICFASLYWWEICEIGLLPPIVPEPLPLNEIAVLHVRYTSHLVLLSLMLIASLIDIDEKIIPDAITVPGTWFGLFIATVYPWAMMPEIVLENANLHMEFVNLTSPNAWPDWLNGSPSIWSLAIALGCWWLWCIGLMPRTWYARHGRILAIRLSILRLLRAKITRSIFSMGVVGSVGIYFVWSFAELRWVGLLSSLVGMAVSGGLVWIVRIVGTAVLQREAMGFGDVTLMAMIGTFIGWQASLLVFFIAPFAGLAIGILVLMMKKEHEIPYGPFLCLATAFTVVLWATVWDRVASVFAMGMLVPVAIIVCVALMAVMLALWKLIQKFIFAGKL